MTDLFCLVADKNMEAAVSGLLGRPKSLGIRRVRFDVRVHVFRDSGCFHDGPEFLRPFRNRATHAIVMLDQAWDGVPCDTSERTEEFLSEKLRKAGMSGWACPVVIEPELDAWVFSGSPHVEKILGWANRNRRLRDALETRNLWRAGDAKPRDPKAAMEWALAQARIRRTSAIYRCLAQRVSTSNCTDRSFQRFRSVLRQWFPVTHTSA